MTPATIGRLVECAIYLFIGAGFTWTGVMWLRAARVSAVDQEKEPAGKGSVFLVVAGPFFLLLGISKLVQVLS